MNEPGWTSVSGGGMSRLRSIVGTSAGSAVLFSVRYKEQAMTSRLRSRDRLFPVSWADET